MTPYYPAITPPTIAWSSSELRDQYNHLSSGFFFSPDTMRFWKSRLTTHYKRLDNNTALFITTERSGFEPNSPRCATVRLARLIEYVREPDGRVCHKIRIDTLDDWSRISLGRAKRFLTSDAHMVARHFIERRNMVEVQS